MFVGMVHHDAEFDVSKPSVAYSDFGKDFNTKEVFMLYDHMIKWISGKASTLGFGIVIRRSDSSFDRRQPFVVMIMEEVTSIKNLFKS